VATFPIKKLSVNTKNKKIPTPKPDVPILTSVTTDNFEIVDYVTVEVDDSKCDKQSPGTTQNIVQGTFSKNEEKPQYPNDYDMTDAETVKNQEENTAHTITFRTSPNKDNSHMAYLQSTNNFETFENIDYDYETHDIEDRQTHSNQLSHSIKRSRLENFSDANTVPHKKPNKTEISPTLTTATYQNTNLTYPETNQGPFYVILPYTTVTSYSLATH